MKISTNLVFPPGHKKKIENFHTDMISKYNFDDILTLFSLICLPHHQNYVSAILDI